MNSITEEVRKSSDELKDEVDAALSRVDRDLDVLKQEVTPEHIINDVILQGRIGRFRSYLRDRPYIATTLSVAALMFIFIKLAKR